jgi:thymidylate synthase (FAD)
LNLRTEEDTQKEHRIIAEEIKKIFIKEFPVTSCALNWL